MRVGVLTGGGDAPGLNAVIRAIVRKGEKTYRDEITGFADGWLELGRVLKKLGDLTGARHAIRQARRYGVEAHEEPLPDLPSA